MLSPWARCVQVFWGVLCAGILGCAVNPCGLVAPVGSCPRGRAARPRLPAPGRKSARWPLEIRMFLWLNCFVASIECVPGLALHSCAGPGGSCGGAQAAGTGITLIVLESESVTPPPPPRHVWHRAAPQGALEDGLGHGRLGRGVPSLAGMLGPLCILLLLCE